MRRQLVESASDWSFDQSERHKRGSKCSVIFNYFYCPTTELLLLAHFYPQNAQPVAFFREDHLNPDSRENAWYSHETCLIRQHCMRTGRFSAGSSNPVPLYCGYETMTSAVAYFQHYTSLNGTVEWSY